MQLYLSLLQYGKVHMMIDHLHTGTILPGIIHHHLAPVVHPQVDVAGRTMQRTGIKQRITLSFQQDGAHSLFQKLVIHHYDRPVEPAVAGFYLLH